MSVFPTNTRTRYLRSLFEGGVKRPDHLRLSADEKEDLARKLLLLANPPHNPVVRELTTLLDSHLFMAFPWMTDHQKEVFVVVQNSDTLSWMLTQ